MMDMDDNVLFKVFVLHPGCNKPEVRRFGIDKGAVASFQYLIAKISSVFPTIRDKTFTVCWKDSDGDEITISSDDELLIALSNIAMGDLKKLYVSVDGQPEKHVAFERFVPRHTPPTLFIEEVKFPERPAMSREVDSERHEGVICDSCNGPVCGFRYKCITCSNFDLCSSCESQEQHGHHFMLRIPFSFGSASHLVSRTLGYKLLKSLRKGGFHDMDNLKSDDEDLGCRYSKKFHKRMAKDHHHHWDRKHHKDHRHQRPQTNLFKTVTDYMNDFVNLMSDADSNDIPNASGDAPQGSKNQASAPKEASTTAEASVSAETLAAENATFDANAESCQGAKRRRDSQKQKQVVFHEEYLQNIGKTFAKILDPFGIDVDIEVKTKKTKSSENRADAASASQNMPSTSTSVPETNKQTQETNTQNVSDELNFTRSTTGKDSPSGDRSDGWTLINDDPSDSELQPADASQPILSSSVLASELDKFAKVFQKHLKLQTEKEPEASESTTKIYPNITGLVETPYNVREPFSSQRETHAQKPSTLQSTEPTTPIDISSQSSVSGNATPEKPSAPSQGSQIETAKEATTQPQQAPQPKAEQTQKPQQQYQRPQYPQTPQQSQGPHPPRHHVPHIAAALDQMISMGFSNDGGWLTQLLESRNGNISAVLDLLTPVSKKN